MWDMFWMCRKFWTWVELLLKHIQVQVYYKVLHAQLKMSLLQTKGWRDGGWGSPVLLLCLDKANQTCSCPPADNNQSMCWGLRPVQCVSWKQSAQGRSPMAPQYAPSLRSRLAPLLLFLQIGLILIYAFYIEIKVNGEVGGMTFRNFYPGEFGRWGGRGRWQVNNSSM